MKTVLKFSGGFKDGQTITGSEAKGYLFLTDNGKIGARFRELPVEARQLAASGVPGLQLQAAVSAALAAFAAASKDPSIPKESLAKTLEECLETAQRKYGIDCDLPKLSLRELEALAKQIAGLETHHIYQVTKRVERGNKLTIHLRFVGDDTTATVEGPY